MTSNLCCCQYIDENDDVNHVVTCFCNCDHLDKGFEELFCCQRVSEENKSGIIQTMQDRLRIPWPGGARQVPFDFFPCIFIPSAILIASLSLTYTTITSIILILILYSASKNSKSCPKFHHLWTWTSITVLFVVFQAIVVPKLELTQMENISCTFLMMAMIWFIVKIKFELTTMAIFGNEKNSETMCTICKTNFGQNQHVYWIDACVNLHLKKYYLLALLSGAAALLYSSNLTLTTICHPRRLFSWATILIPDDCEDVYYLSELSIPFVCALYSILMGLILLYKLFALVFANTSILVPIYKCSHRIVRFVSNCNRFSSSH